MLERTGWRDQELSAEHRRWGFDCPAVDIDFLLAEYDTAKPVAIVDYKHYRSLTFNPQDANLRTLCNLADDAGLMFFIAMYWPVAWAFRVYPQNDAARDFFADPYEIFSQRTYVRMLYRLRKRRTPPHIDNNLNDVYPPDAAVLDLRLSGGAP